MLEDKTRQALERASRLFHLLHPKEDVRSVFSALSSEDRRIRASAQEFLGPRVLRRPQAASSHPRLSFSALTPDTYQIGFGNCKLCLNARLQSRAHLIGNMWRGMVDLTCLGCSVGRKRPPRTLGPFKRY